MGTLSTPPVHEDYNATSADIVTYRHVAFSVHFWSRVQAYFILCTYYYKCALGFSIVPTRTLENVLIKLPFLCCRFSLERYLNAWEKGNKYKYDSSMENRRIVRYLCDSFSIKCVESFIAL